MRIYGNIYGNYVITWSDWIWIRWFMVQRCIEICLFSLMGFVTVSINLHANEMQAISNGIYTSRSEAWGDFFKKNTSFQVVHYNILQHTTTYYNILQHTTTYYNILQHTTTYYNILQPELLWENDRKQSMFFFSTAFFLHFSKNFIRILAKGVS